MYPEEFQYIDRTHADKEEAWKNKIAADDLFFHRPDDPAFRTVSLDFHGVDSLMNSGATFSRVPGTESTRLMFIDIDHKDTDPYFDPIEYHELDSVLDTLEFVEYAIHRSAGASSGSWHVVALMPREVPMDAYKDVAHGYSIAIRNALASMYGKEAPYVCDPALENNPRQMIFGHPVAEPGPVHVPGSGPRHLEKTKYRPDGGRIPDHEIRRVPINPGEFIRYLDGRGHLEEQRVYLEYAFQAWLPYMRKGAAKTLIRIPPGRRHSVVTSFIGGLRNCWAAWNSYLEEHGLEPFTPEDFKVTVAYYIKGSTDPSGDFDERQYIDSAWGYTCLDGMTYSDWCRSNAGDAIMKGNGPKHRFVTNIYRKEKALSIIESRKSAGECLFDSREAMGKELDSAWLTRDYFARIARSSGVAVRFADRVPSRKSVSLQGGRPVSLSLDGVLLEISGRVDGDCVFYSGKLLAKHKMFLRRKGYRIKKEKK